jgi:hypothetical protein
MENEIAAKLQEQDAKLDAIYRSVEKTRKYMLISVIITVVMLVLPLIIGIFVVPFFLNSYLSSFEGLL